MLYTAEIGKYDIVGCIQVTFKDAAPKTLESLRLYCAQIASFANLVSQIEAEKLSDVSQRDSTIENMFKAWRLERQSTLDDKERAELISLTKREYFFDNAINTATMKIYLDTREKRALQIQMSIRQYLARKKVRRKREMKADRDHRDKMRRMRAEREREKRERRKGSNQNASTLSWAPKQGSWSRSRSRSRSRTW